MYAYSPSRVYAHESVVAHPTYKARMDRVIAALGKPVTPVVFNDEDLPAILYRDSLLGGRVPMGSLAEIPDPILLLNTYRFDGKSKQRQERLHALVPSTAWGYHLSGSLVGARPFDYARYNQEGDHVQHIKVCRPCWRLHFQNGCLHKCHYCPFGGLIVSMVNAEDYIARLDQLIAAHPWQEVYLLEDDADVLCLEPELGCMGPIIEYFGTLPDRYLVIHTKSHNVDWMLNLKHNGKTIVVWSLAAPTQAEKLEPVTGTTAQRIEAARKCQQAGYTVRYKFKPIIPVTHWRAEAADTIRLLFDRTKPDVISLAVFMWMELAEMKRRLPMDLLDPTYVQAAEAAVGDGEHAIFKPFPLAVRKEIYEFHLREIRKHDADIPVSLSTESFQLWHDMAPVLGADATSYVCGCGPNSTPGRKKLLCHPFTTPHIAPGTHFHEM